MVVSTLTGEGLKGNNLETQFTMTAANMLNSMTGLNVAVFRSGNVVPAPGAPAPVVVQSQGIGFVFASSANVVFNVAVFEAGTFTRIGDGGFLNLAVTGNCAQSGGNGEIFTCQ